MFPDTFVAGAAERWRAAVLAYVAGVVASVTFVVSVALIDRLEAAV